MIQVVKRIEDANCITHSGTMHADEVFATAFLDLYLGDVRVFRTNQVDFSKVPDNALVYDIGRGEFDHHQVGAEVRENGIPYCSFGLLWRKFGRDFLKKYDISLIDKVFIGIDKDLIEGIDADDNGVFPKVEANYKVKMLPGVIKLFNPSFDSFQEEGEQFLKACSIARAIFEEEVFYINGKVYAEEQILELLNTLTTEDKYLILDRFLPYEETLLNSPQAESIFFVAYPSNRGGYAIKVVPKSCEDHTARMPFPDEWAGKEGRELEEISGIEGLTFCHAGRFIVNCKDLDAVYRVFSHLFN